MKNPHAVALGRLGGQQTSEKKAQSSRENGKKGGRPRRETMTTNTATDTQIQRLRIEALRAGDLLQAAICERALGLTPSVPDDDIYARALEMRRDEARAECARVISEAEAMAD